MLLIEGALLSLLQFDPAYLIKIYLPVFGALWRHRMELHAVRCSAMASRRLTGADYFAAFDRRPYKLRMLCRYGLPKMG
jgi:hypothetical protein